MNLLALAERIGQALAAPIRRRRIQWRKRQIQRLRAAYGPLDATDEEIEIFVYGNVLREPEVKE